MGSFCRYRHHKRNKGTGQKSSHRGFILWWDSVADPGEGPKVPAAPHPLSLEQTEARRAKKIFFGDCSPPSPPPPHYLKVGIRHWHCSFCCTESCVSVPTEGAWLWIEKERP